MLANILCWRSLYSTNDGPAVHLPDCDFSLVGQSRQPGPIGREFEDVDGAWVGDLTDEVGRASLPDVDPRVSGVRSQ